MDGRVIWELLASGLDLWSEYRLTETRTFRRLLNSTPFRARGCKADLGNVNICCVYRSYSTITYALPLSHTPMMFGVFWRH